MYIKRPEEMISYYGNNGWHFSKKAFQFAVSKMRKKSPNGDEEKVKPYTMEEVDDILTRNNVNLRNDNGYDKVYVATMIRADYWGSSISDEQHLAKHIKDVLDDPDGGEEKVFRHWISDMSEKSVSIPWIDIL